MGRGLFLFVMSPKLGYGMSRLCRVNPADVLRHVLDGRVNAPLRSPKGARAEVERIERYHRDHNDFEFDAPLFGTRGLFTSHA